MSDPQNLRYGDMDVYYGEEALGYTLGGTSFANEREFLDIKTDQHSTPMDKILTGAKIFVKMMLAETTKKNLSRGLPESRFDENVVLGDSKLGLGRDNGYSLLQDAKLLRLHPRNRVGSDRSEDIYIFKAVSIENVEQDFKVDEQRVLELTFEGLTDTTQPDGQRVGRIGDPDIS